jgi:hypothetical protein
MKINERIPVKLRKALIPLKIRGVFPFILS